MFFRWRTKHDLFLIRQKEGEKEENTCTDQSAPPAAGSQSLTYVFDDVPFQFKGEKTFSICFLFLATWMNEVRNV
jgi:hypothetical protein